MRVERDALGERTVPKDVYWGIHTERSIENFPISGLSYPSEMPRAIGAIKAAAAQANMELSVLDPEIGNLIVQAAREVMEGIFDNQFPVDVYQAGAGTSFNMNANEVIANRALALIDEPRGNYKKIGPNDHVNMSQSTNDAFPTALRIAALWKLERELYPAVERLRDAFTSKSEEFADILTAGRTHLQDAVPITLGQEFGGYAAAVERAIERIRESADALKRVNLGATAVGTGINTPPGYQPIVVDRLSKLTELELQPAENLFEITQSAADFSLVSSALRLLALEMIRISNDLRLLSSGPKTGFAEIRLPAVQPGSSIMPGKVNPSIPEMVDMVGFQVVGNDTTVALAVQAGQMELNVMLPVVAYNLLQSVRILSRAALVLSSRCIEGITANRETAEKYAEESEAVVTALSPHIGYLKAADIAKEALSSNKSIREIALEQDLMDEEELDRVLDLRTMTGRGSGH
ncbi:MAG: aspartate ammonia-lyase [Armatimonadota bacterium]